MYPAGVNRPAPEQRPVAPGPITPADAAYEAGDYRMAQRLAADQLAADGASRAAGAAVLAHLRPDRVQWATLSACALLFVTIAVVYGS